MWIICDRHSKRRETRTDRDGRRTRERERAKVKHTIEYKGFTVYCLFVEIVAACIALLHESGTSSIRNQYVRMARERKK